jgi:DNA-binding NarL/FixJ family response regulator
MLTTFIVDDSPAVRERLVGLLREVEGVEITGEAGDGESAVAGIAASRPDVVFLDINLPGRNGLEVLRAVKAVPSPPRVYMLTNHPHPLYWKKCMDEGADGFFDKTTEFHRVVETVRALLRGS